MLVRGVASCPPVVVGETCGGGWGGGCGGGCCCAPHTGGAASATHNNNNVTMDKCFIVSSARQFDRSSSARITTGFHRAMQVPRRRYGASVLDRRGMSIADASDEPTEVELLVRKEAIPS